MRSEEAPYLVKESILKIGKKKLRIYHLSDGRRLINSDDIADIFDIREEDDESRI